MMRGWPPVHVATIMIRSSAVVLVALVVHGLAELSSGNPMAFLSLSVAAWLAFQTHKLHEMVKAGQVERYALFARDPAATDLMGSQPTSSRGDVGSGGFGRGDGRNEAAAEPYASQDGAWFAGLGKGTGELPSTPKPPANTAGVSGSGGGAGGSGGVAYEGAGLVLAVMIALAVVPL
mmetsp:Transcript_66218/g.182777  ORF Transcript_66218/g.182777 Transcript_66218/m.182777 type:complete len:177 (-) Transcript_66218:174-704(-)